MSSTQGCIVNFYHDIEQDFDSDADPSVCRDVVGRFMELESRYGARGTYNVVGKLFAAQPELVQSILDAGHEVAFHSHGHHRDWSPRYYAEEVALCRATSALPTGYRSPRSQWGKETLEALAENGFLWSAENEPKTTEPYFIHRGVVRLPLLADDWQVFRGRQTIDAWQRQFESALDTRPFVALGMHDCVAASDPDVWLASWERMLQAASRRGALMVTCSEAADLFRRGAVARHYDATVRDWNEHSKRLYRSMRFQELLQEEAARLEQPTIADLASAGGMQSYPLEPLARHIYCVDNSPGMVASVRSSDKLEGLVGELAATNLPEASIDLVFCVNAIEYLYSVEDLADEVKRIAAPGATCLVAFPALGGCPPRPPISPPDRIQSYFTRDDVVRWGELVGDGRVLGIQYVATEPETEEREAEYRRMELDRPAGAVPMFWVYVGKVDRDRARSGAIKRNMIPLSECPFRFPALRFQGIKRAFRLAKKRVPRPIKQAAKALLGRPSRGPR